MRRVVAALVVAAAAIAACGEERRAQPDPFAELEQEFRPPDPSQRSAPRWERVRVLRGVAGATETIEVDSDAIQWRLRWTCQTGTLRVIASPPPGGGAAAEGACGRPGMASFIGSGSRSLAVAASGRWRMLVEQQVDTPLREARLPGMTAAHVVAEGAFTPVERTGRGTATVYRLPSDKLALRLEGFVTEPNSDLFVWLSDARAPRTSKAAVSAPRRVLGPLKATSGDINYLLEIDEPPRSIVIWCRPVRIAYTAAVLRRPAQP